MPGPAWVLFAGTFINRSGSFVLPFLVLYLTSAGYPIAIAGAVTAAYGAGGLAASLAGGLIADRFGRRNAIALSMFSSAAAMVGLGLVRPLPAIAAFAVLAGATSEAYRPASAALLADLVPEQRRVTAYALYRFAINLGFAIGPAAAGFLASRSFLFLFIGDAATSVVFGVLALLALPHGNRQTATANAPAPGYRAALRDPVLLMFCASVLALAFVFLQSATGFALAVRDDGFSTQTYGVLLAANGLLIVLCELPITSVTQRLAPVPVMMTGILLLGLGFASLALARSVPLLLLAVVVWTAGEMIQSPVSGAYLANLSPANLRGRYAGIFGLMWALAAILAPSVGGLLFALAPHGVVLWAVCALLSVVAALLLLATGRRRRRLTAAEPIAALM
jgi:MFS family permease